MEEKLFKKCSKCGIEKELCLENFGKLSRSKDGFRGQCKECRKAYRDANKEKIAEYKKEYREANKEKIAEYKKEYREANKEKIAKMNKAYREANKEKIAEQKKKYYENNKEKIIEKQKEYYIKNKEEIILYSRRYYKEYYPQNREKHLINAQKRRTLLRELPNTLTSEEYKQTLEYFNHSCAYCGCELNKDNHHMEHVVPVSKGGGTTQENIIPSCESCNLSKHTKTLADWYRFSDDFSIEKLTQIAKHLAQFTDWVVSVDE